MVHVSMYIFDSVQHIMTEFGHIENDMRVDRKPLVVLPNGYSTRIWASHYWTDQMILSKVSTMVPPVVCLYESTLVLRPRRCTNVGITYLGLSII